MGLYLEKRRYRHMENIININIEKVYPHPDNPRKDLGDLSELVESVRKKGIMQNLAVIPGHWITDEEYKGLCNKYKEKPSEELRMQLNNGWVPEGYTLVIGHRRCAAAKLAGLRELPCMVVDGMDKKEQVAIMLEENMQRNDLTIWEQANGFQMMLDLGGTEQQIAEKTGFSRATIRHRLNIAKLDQAELKKKEQDAGFQLSLGDLYALEKISDIATRNKILATSTDSRQLAWKAQNAVKEAESAEKYNKIVKMLEEAGVQRAPEKAKDEQYTGKWETVKEYPLEKDVPGKLALPKKTEGVYYLRLWDRVRVIRKAAKKQETAEEKAHKEKEKNKRQIKAAIKEMDARKRDFILSIISGKIKPVKERAEVQEEIWHVLVHMDSYFSVSMSGMRRFFTGKQDYDCTEEERKEADNIIGSFGVLEQMMLVLGSALENAGDIYNYQGQCDLERTKSIRQAYAVLEKYGWYFKDEEVQLLDGTHGLYEKKGQ